MPDNELDDVEDGDIPNEFWKDLTEEERRRRKSKVERLGVEDKVVDSETK